MFSYEGELILDDDAGDIVTDGLAYVEERKLTSDLLKKCREVLKEKIFPDLKEITDTMQNNVKNMEITDEILEVNVFEPGDDLEEEIRVYIIALTEQCVEEVWKDDLHRTLDMTLNTMLQGGRMRMIDEQTPGVYEEWKKELVEYQEKIGDTRKKYYDISFDNMSELIGDKEKLINEMMYDKRLVKLIYLFNQREDEVEIKIARKDEVLPINE